MTKNQENGKWKRQAAYPLAFDTYFIIHLALLFISHIFDALKKTSGCLTHHLLHRIWSDKNLFTLTDSNFHTFG